MKSNTRSFITIVAIGMGLMMPPNMASADFESFPELSAEWWQWALVLGTPSFMKSKLSFARTVLGSTGHFARLIGQSIFEPSRRLRLREIGLSLGYVEVKPQLETTPFNEILSDQTIQLTRLSHENWGIEVFELAVINAFIAARKPLRIFEIGTFLGRTTRNMSLNSERQTRLQLLTCRLRNKIYQTAGQPER